MAIPNLTNAQRAQALEKAKQVRTERAAIKDRVRTGAMTLVQAMDEPVMQKCRLNALLKSQKGVGAHAITKFYDEAAKSGVKIAENRRVGGLTQRQRDYIVEYFTK